MKSLRLKAIFTTLLFLLLLANNSFALTWPEAKALAEKQSQELQSAAKGLEATEWSYKRSFSPILPQLSANAGVSESDSSAKSYSYGLTVSQTLFQGLNNIYAIKTAAANLEYQKAAARASQANYYYDLRSTFLAVLVGQENIQLLEKILKQRQDNSKLIQLRYDSGKEDKGNSLSTKSDAAQAEYDLAAAKRELKLARLKMGQLLQQPVAQAEETVTISDPTDQDLVPFLNETPAYVMAKYQLESADLAQQATISGFLPSLSLSGSYRKSGADWPPTSSSKSWSLSASYSLFPGGTNVIDRALYSVRLDQARADFAVASQEVEYSLQNAYAGLQNAANQYKVSQLSLAAAEQRAAISRVKYLNGLTTYDEWDRIESAYIQAQKSLLVNKKQVLLAEAAWAKTYGGYVK